jgi:tetratricopeptide (TPR) repeat protein
MLCLPAVGQTTAEEWFDKGVTLMNQDNYHGAFQAFDKAAELNPQYVEAWAGKGWALYGSSRYNEAVQAYNIAIELDPNYPDAWIGKGFALTALAWGDPRATFEQAISLDPNYGLAWLGEWIAGVYYEEAIRLNPKYAAEILPDTSKTLSFQRMVFLKEGRPRVRLNVAPVPSTVHQKTVVARFAELNEFKKNVTKRI